jgi:hypothetical protein
MKQKFRRYETMTLAELEKLHDELVKKLGVLSQKFAVLQQRIAASKALQRKPKRVRKYGHML